MSDVVRKLKDKAAELTAKGKVPQALETWQRVVAEAPDDVAARQKVAELFAKLGKKPEAIATYEDVAKRYAEKGLFFKASAVCRLVLGLDPAHQRTQALIATLFARDQAQAAPKKPAPAPVQELEIEIEIAVEPPVATGLPSIPLFSTLTADELKEVLGTAMEVRAFAPGQLVVAEGAPGDSMFAMVEGSAAIYRGWGSDRQRQVASVGAGEIFGEVALVSGAPRVATVVVDGDAIALEFPRDAMARVIASHPRVGEMLEQFCHERLLANALRASPILRALPEADQRALSASFQPCTFVNGQRIITQGAPADFVYVLVRGVAAVAHESGERYPDLQEGDLFGELAVLSDGPATASVRASGTALTLRLPAGEFKARVMKHPAAIEAVQALAKARLARTAQLDQSKSPEHDARV